MGLHRQRRLLAEHPDLRAINLFVEQGAFSNGAINLMVNTGLPGFLCMFLVMVGGSVAAWRILREIRRHRYEDPFALACSLIAASWLTTLFGFIFIQGNASLAMITLALPCRLTVLCEWMLHQRSKRGAEEALTGLAGGGP